MMKRSPFSLRFAAPSPIPLHMSVLLYKCLHACVLAKLDDLIPFLNMSNGQGGDGYSGTEGEGELQALFRAIDLKCDLHTKKLGL